jgi:hypothetical protein
MPDDSFTSLAVILAAAFAAPLVLGMFPRVRLPAVVLEIVLAADGGLLFEMAALILFRSFVIVGCTEIRPGHGPFGEGSCPPSSAIGPPRTNLRVRTWRPLVRRISDP